MDTLKTSVADLFGDTVSGQEGLRLSDRYKTEISSPQHHLLM